ncbi:MAG: hypothetical protein ACJAYU_002559 [Bradymonadia bacterium]|jgi:hypothetical protein
MTGFPTLPQEQRSSSALFGLLALAVIGLGLWYSGVFNCGADYSSAMQSPCSASAAAVEAPCPYSEGAAPVQEKISQVPSAASGAEAYADSPCSASMGLWNAPGIEPATSHGSVKGNAAE